MVCNKLCKTPPQMATHAEGVGLALALHEANTMVLSPDRCLPNDGILKVLSTYSSGSSNINNSSLLFDISRARWIDIGNSIKTKLITHRPCLSRVLQEYMPSSFYDQPTLEGLRRLSLFHDSVVGKQDHAELRMRPV